MAHIPEAVLQKQPVLPGLPPPKRGKVRDCYELPEHPELLLFVASDRISVFDFVLNAAVGRKGEVLTAMNHFMNQKLRDEDINTDLVAVGSAIDPYLPQELRGNVELQKRGTIVRRLKGPEFEDIVRICLTGSGWKSYKETGMAFEYPLPINLTEGCLLPEPIYTPTTKADTGHDKSVSAASVAEKYGTNRQELSLIAARICSKFAQSRGIVLADTKFEISVDANGGLVIVDEVATADSSRFWDEGEWKKCQAKKKMPSSFDKQFVRNWAKTVDIEKDENGRTREPENETDIAYVHSQIVPHNIINNTIKLYLYIFWRLTGMKLETYQREVMGIDVADPKRHIEILVGSESDLPQTKAGVLKLSEANVTFNVNVVSCHRNPQELLNLVSRDIQSADVVIAGAGMAAALPGVVKGWLCHFGRSDIPVIGVGFEGANSVLTNAAALSIECLPETPVEMQENGIAYLGEAGFSMACHSAINDEFMVRGLTPKPVRLGVQSNA